MLERWIRAVLRRRRVVVGAWVLVLVLGTLASFALPSRLTTSLAVPGSPSDRANAVLIAHFGQNIEGTFTVIEPLSSPTKAEVARLEHGIVAAARTIPTANVTEQRVLFGLLYANIDTSLALNHASTHTDALRRALAEQGLHRAMVTGPPALQSDLTPILNHDLYRGELLAIALALALLVAVLGLCWALALPIVVAAATAAGSLGVVWLLAHRFLMVLYVPNVVELIGFGLAVDYSLLIVHRFRGEIATQGTSLDDAIVRTMATAGRTVVLSGLAVAIGLTTLLLVPVPFVRSLGAAGLAVPVLAVAVALSLQPALLSLLGRRGVRSVGVHGLIARRDVRSGAWAHVARGVLRHPVRVLVVGLMLLVVAGVPVFWFQLTPASLTAIPHGIESARALAYVEHRAGPAIITPTNIVIDTGVAHGDTAPGAAAARQRLIVALLGEKEVQLITSGQRPPYVDPSGRYALLYVVNRHYYGDEVTQHFVTHLRQEVIAGVRFPPGTTVLVGGAGAQGVDFLHSVYGTFPWIVLLLLALVYLVLVRAFRSLLLPLIAVLLDLVSVTVTYGLLAVVFRFGLGSSLLGTYHVAQIEGWVPVFVFAVLFGLSSDYEVFIVARMRESWDAGSGTREAIVDGLAHTGGVVSAAAVIMVGALSGLIFGRIAGLQELGLGLAIGVLIDATVVRGLVLPALMAKLGRWNWWLPEGVGRLTKTMASPLVERGARP
jgi:RND superfamily putative drug exporter